LFYNLRSPRNLTSNMPVKTPADIKNVKMRLSQTPLQVAMWSAAGASTTSIALSETFTALGQGVVNMQENPFDLIYANSFYEVQKYANETEHIFSSILYVVGEKQFNALPEDLQKVVLDASKEIQQYANDLYFETKDTYKNLCVENGMQINSDVDKEAFKEVMVPAVKSFFKEDIWELYEKIVALGA
jgi:TRAP-type C4-dicarboxylate transport system substrate-binding protein